MKTTCPQCKSTLDLEDKTQTGTTITCSHCKHVFAFQKTSEQQVKEMEIEKPEIHMNQHGFKINAMAFPYQAVKSVRYQSSKKLMPKYAHWRRCFYTGLVLSAIYAVIFPLRFITDFDSALYFPAGPVGIILLIVAAIQLHKLRQQFPDIYGKGMGYLTISSHDQKQLRLKINDSVDEKQIQQIQINVNNINRTRPTQFAYTPGSAFNMGATHS